MAVTDNRQWQPPGGLPAASPAPAGGEQFTAPSGSPGWTPPPKPGLVPLRPLQLGTILGASFRTLRRNPRPTFGVSLLVQGVISLVSGAVIGGVFFAEFSRVGSATSADQATIAAGAVGAVALSAIVPVLLSLAASALLQGIIVLEVSRATLGEKQTTRRLLARGRGRFGALIGYTMLLTLVVLVVLGVVVGVIVLLIVALGTVGIVLAVLLGIVAGLALIVLFFWIGTKLSLVPSALMLERLPIRAAIARSWSLTRGSFWRTLGIELLVYTIASSAQQVVSFPLSFVFGIVLSLVDPNGQQSSTTVALTVGFAVLALAVGVVFSSIVAVVTTATTALIYLDLRMRREGLDLELARFVEARQAGDASVRDPYLPAA